MNNTNNIQREKRYNNYVDYLRLKFGGRIQKVTIDAGFTCPNRDGKVAVGGCTYCNNDAFNPSYNSPLKSVYQQVEEGIEFHKGRYTRVQTYLAYFQAYSNTYKPLEELKVLYEEALSHPDVVGLVIGTRPDCVDEAKLDYIQELSKKYYVIVEYGIESCYEETLKKINRGHNLDVVKWALCETSKRGISTGAHFIIGLPGETKEMILNQTDFINSLPLDTIKFHQLQIFKNTQMAKDYAKSPKEFKFFTIDEYIDLFIDILERLRPDLVIERFAGEAPPRFHVTEGWGLIRNFQLLEMLDKRLVERDTYQGRLFNKM